MIYKFIVIFGLASVLQASVIINVYEDSENKASHSLHESCNVRCDQQCRKYGLSGACDGNKCECDMKLHNTAAHKGGYLLDGNCNYRACDQLCRRLGFTGGACVGDKCKCDNFEPLIIKSEALNYLLTSKITPQKACIDKSCDDLCKILGFPGGSCLEDKCNCRSKEVHGEALDTVLMSPSDIAPISDSCNKYACNALCEVLGFPGGACLGDKCNCRRRLEKAANDGVFYRETDNDLDNYLIEERMPSYKDVAVDSHLMSSYNNAPASDSCNNGACNALCKLLGFPGGACLGGKCYCRSRLEKDVVVESHQMSLYNKAPDSGSCNNDACNALCKLLGFPGGACLGDKCNCRSKLEKESNDGNLYMATDNELDNNLMDLESTSTSSKDKAESSSASSLTGKCYNVNCYFTCARMHYMGGSCVGDSCICY